MNHGQNIQKLEDELAVLENELQCRYCLMGKRLMELAESEQRVVDQLVDELIAKKRQLALAKNEKQCESCQQYNSAESRFCRSCGQRLPDSGETQRKGEQHGSKTKHP